MWFLMLCCMHANDERPSSLLISAAQTLHSSPSKHRINSSSCTVLIHAVQPANPLLIKTTTWPSIHLHWNQRLSILAQCDSHLSSVFLSSLNPPPPISNSRKEEEELGLPYVNLSPHPSTFLTLLLLISSRGRSPYLFFPLSLIFIFFPFLPASIPCSPH